jgi:hypothetical protein
MPTPKKHTEDCQPFLRPDEIDKKNHEEIMETFRSKSEKEKPPCFLFATSPQLKDESGLEGICLHQCKRFDRDAWWQRREPRTESCKGRTSKRGSNLKEILGIP